MAIETAMLHPNLAWAICVLMILVIGLILHIRRDSFTALGVMVALSFALPVWVKIDIAGLPFDVRTTVAIVGLLAFAIRDFRWIFSPLTLVDAAITSMVVIHFASDVYHGASPVETGLQAYGEWAIPYLAGRYAMRLGTPSSLARWVSIVVVILSIGGLIEAATQINIWEQIFGIRPLNGASRSMQRFGIKRAYGTCLHAIFFGMLILTLLPWPLSIASASEQRKSRLLGAGIAFLGCLGVASSISRSVILDLGVMFALAILMWMPRGRWLIFLMTLLAGIFLVAEWENVVWLVNQSAGVKRKAHILIELDGEEIDYDYTRNRLLVARAYLPALQHAGLLGYGTKATSTFPPNIPYLPEKAKTVQRLRSIDNAYLLFGLRFGWLGIAAFTSLFATAVWIGWRQQWDRTRENLSGWLAALLAAFLIVFPVVWMSYDFGFAAIWTCGVASGLAARRAEESRHFV